MAGFGGGGADKSKTKKVKETKLKPKQQWDRYLDLKADSKIRVAVRVLEVEDDDASKEWLEVGRIKSKGNQYTAIAVARQRAVIAEHAKRIYPLKVSNKNTLEWGYSESSASDESSGDDEWNVVDKSILDESTPPAGIEKIIGFEGRPDPATGFYCVYDGGKLQTDETFTKRSKEAF